MDSFDLGTSLTLDAAERFAGPAGRPNPISQCDLRSRLMLIAGIALVAQLIDKLADASG
jgi:hypothetical protein